MWMYMYTVATYVDYIIRAVFEITAVIIIIDTPLTAKLTYKSLQHNYTCVL